MGSRRSENIVLSQEERLLISRATELSERPSDTAVASSFLSPREQRLVFEALEKKGCAGSAFFWGGYVGAVRRKAVFLPPWILDGENCREALFSEEREKHFLSLLEGFGMPSLLDELIFPLKLSGSGYETLSHRDWLGALMALGLKRSVMGDIVCEKTCATVFFEDVAANYVLLEMKNAGKDRIRCERTSVGSDFQAAQNFEHISTTVASPRLDGIIKALLKTSREQAAELVSKGSCEINYFEECEPDTPVCAGDILSVRGFGKYIIDKAEDETRKGRIRVLARKYL